MTSRLDLPWVDPQGDDKRRVFNKTQGKVTALMVYDKIKEVLDNEKIQLRDRIEYATALENNLLNLPDIPKGRAVVSVDDRDDLRITLYGDKDYKVYTELRTTDIKDIQADTEKYTKLAKEAREEVEKKLANLKKLNAALPLPEEIPAKKRGFLSRLLKRKPKPTIYSYTNLPKETLQGSSQGLSQYIVSEIPPFNGPGSRASGSRAPGSRAPGSRAPGSNLSTINEEGGGTRKRQRRKGHYRTRKSNTRRKVKHSSTRRRQRKT